ncbi:PilX N-terminal domain-containing pilus assembly protein [Geothrix sp. 21YS21S-4]|uniref:PilX N-terminal domain-containing pilus assembly protein n=1 Tax=Geothrix sp. 21YS21S-4 TaxID=3068889 RepID=UPI0027B949F8|nr:PilX N-terminal domain-containing pilus assembly protein [Geothrix sp. 21YS21S-4]
MPVRTPSPLRRSEAGGITIVVTLMLLVLLTVASVAMAKNALREMIVSGTSRQGAEVRTVADTGLEYTIYWMIQERENRPAVDSSVTTGYQRLIWVLDQLRDNPELGGQYFKVGTSSDMTVSLGTGKTGTFDLWALQMGKLPIVLTSQIDERLKPDLWAIRSNGVYDYGGSMQFQHSRETWVSTTNKQQ